MSPDRLSRAQFIHSLLSIVLNYHSSDLENIDSTKNHNVLLNNSFTDRFGEYLMLEQQLSPMFVLNISQAVVSLM